MCGFLHKSFSDERKKYIKIMFRINFIPKTVTISNNNPFDTIGVWYLSQAIKLLAFSNWLPYSSFLAFR